jgi:hypothetical protein
MVELVERRRQVIGVQMWEQGPVHFTVADGELLFARVRRALPLLADKEDPTQGPEPHLVQPIRLGQAERRGPALAVADPLVMTARNVHLDLMDHLVHRAQNCTQRAGSAWT